MSKKWKQESVDISLIDEAGVNANQMSQEAFERLKENIKLTGGLSSAIGCYRKTDTGRFVIISGHHRYRACEQLRFKEVPVIYAEESDLTKDEIIALQLSHNSLHGEDNKGILKRLFDEISSIEFKQAAFVDVNEIQPITLDSISLNIEKEQFSVSVILYRKGYEDLKSLLGLVEEKKQNSDIVLLADGEKNEDEFLALSTALRNRYEIKSPNVQFSKLLELARKQMEAETNGSETQEIPRIGPRYPMDDSCMRQIQQVLESVDTDADKISRLQEIILKDVQEATLGCKDALKY